ncbi:MAG: glycosyltransferase, partial [Deltaproteobacteria bacterium]|nr:glycosyltransferase [Deltaproteobacteria bacterium]
MSELVFWLLVATVLYTYFGYALLIPLIGLFVKRPLDRRDITPRVTFLITAYNEEKNIRKKLTEVLALDYPQEHLEVMVASDGSTDRTDEIVGEFRDQGVVLKRVE